MIKKVVIPKEETRYCFELNESEMSKIFNIKDIDSSKVKTRKVFVPVENNEVNINNVDLDKIYACVCRNNIYKLNRVSDLSKSNMKYNFMCLNESCQTIGDALFFKDKIKDIILGNENRLLESNKLDVYQIDTQEEFLLWSIQQTGGKVRQVSAEELADRIFDKSECVKYLSISKDLLIFNLKQIEKDITNG